MSTVPLSFPGFSTQFLPLLLLLRLLLLLLLL